jgi:hypothetical protein
MNFQPDPVVVDRIQFIKAEGHRSLLDVGQKPSLIPCCTGLSNMSAGFIKAHKSARHRWLTPVILATWEAETGRIVVPSHPRQVNHETPSQPKASWVCW